MTCPELFLRPHEYKTALICAEEVTRAPALFLQQHATEADAGAYRVVVANGSGAVPSAEVQVGVKVLAELGIATYAGLQVHGPVGRTFRI